MPVRYDATDRISAREAMRHPYFKEAREADAKKTVDGSTAAAEEQSATSSSGVDPRKGGQTRQLANVGVGSVGGSKVNVALNKGLPSIGGDVHDPPPQKQVCAV